jgi:hypothetical protein
MKGGSGAATNAINVFGGIGAQRAAGANDNTIAMKQQGGSGAATNAINVFGGIGAQHAAGANDNTIAMKQQGGKKGGSFGVDLGAPLVLTGLNQYVKGRKSAKKGGKKGGKSKKVKRGGKRRRSAKKMRGGDGVCAKIDDHSVKADMVDDMCPEGYCIYGEEGCNDTGELPPGEGTGGGKKKKGGNIFPHPGTCSATKISVSDPKYPNSYYKTDDYCQSGDTRVADKKLETVNIQGKRRRVREHWYDEIPAIRKMYDKATNKYVEYG